MQRVKLISLFEFVRIIVVVGLIIITTCTIKMNNANNASIRITELCSNNKSIVVDDDRGILTNYIEIYNDSGKEMCLDKWYITDNRNEKKNNLDGLIIGPYGFLVLQYENELKYSGGNIYLVDKQWNTVVNHIKYPYLKADEVYSEEPGKEGVWKKSDFGTPGHYNEFGKDEAPIFSAESGYYDSDFGLSLYSKEGDDIYYTLDGSEPDRESNIYSGPITIKNRSDDVNKFNSIRNITYDWKEYMPSDEKVDKMTIVRAVSYNENGMRSDVVTKSYLIGLDGYKDEMVFSIVADSDELFGDNGIYVTGKEYDDWYLGGAIGDAPVANFIKHIEIEGYCGIFCHENVEEKQVGIKLQGESNRTFIAKRIALRVDRDFDAKNYFDTVIFTKDDVPVHSLVFRLDDTDAIFHDIVATENTTLGVQPSRIVTVFLNGEYWYSTFARQKYSKRMISQEYKIYDKNCIELTDNARDVIDRVIELNEKDELSTNEKYSIIDSMMDIDNYIDYIINNIYMCNMDTNESKNTKVWRTNIDDNIYGYGDNKYRWLIYDTDCILWVDPEYYSAEHRFQIDSFSEIRQFAEPSYITDSIFAFLIKNESFKEKFVIRFMDLANTAFTTEKVLPILKKYGYDLSWMDDFFIYRFDYITDYMKSALNLNGEKYLIQLKSNKPQACEISVNTTETLKDGWKGYYFSDYPVTVHCNVKNHNEFVCWKNEKGEVVSRDNEYTFYPSKDIVLYADIE